MSTPIQTTDDVLRLLCQLIGRAQAPGCEVFGSLSALQAEASAMLDEEPHEEDEEPPLEANVQRRRRQPCPRCEDRYTIEGGRPCPICRPELRGFDDFMDAPSPREEGMDPPDEEESSPIPGMSRDEYDERMARAAHSREMHRAMYGRGRKEDAEDA